MDEIDINQEQILKKLYLVLISLLLGSEQSKYANQLFNSEDKMTEVNDQICKIEEILKPKKFYFETIKDYLCYFSEGNENDFLKSDPFDFNNPFFKSFKGFTLSWVLEHFDVTNFTKKFPQLSDLPLHGTIISGPFDTPSGMTSEGQMLTQICSYLYKITKYKERFDDLTKGKILIELEGKDQQLLHSLPFFIIDFSIQTFLNLMTFVECFVNSVAFDYTQENPSIPQETKNFLSDYNGNIPTITKLIKYPQLINEPDRLEIINKKITNNDITGINDKYDKLTQLRNSYIHNSPNPNIKKPKQSILMNHYGWFDKTNEAFDICIDVAKDFWHKCGHESGPNYLFGLDKLTLREKSKPTFSTEIAIIGDLISNKYLEELKQR